MGEKISKVELICLNVKGVSGNVKYEFKVNYNRGNCDKYHSSKKYLKSKWSKRLGM